MAGYQQIAYLLFLMLLESFKSFLSKKHILARGSSSSFIFLNKAI